MKQIGGIFLLLYVFALLQMSFFIHFFPKGLIPNLLILSVLGISIKERQESRLSFFAALWGGFLLDVFSQGIIGVWPTVLLLLTLGIKKIQQDYVRISIP